jgi:acyl-CoA synthetase (AMP-forming)/AMP-acid ligase II
VVAFAEAGAALTYAELADAAEARARGFAARGVARGDRVAVVLPAGLPCVETFWALELLGAVPCLFSPATPAPTLAARIERVRPMLVLTSDNLDEQRPRTGLAQIDARPDELVFLQLTSGTSGEPRAAMITNANLHAFLYSLAGAGHTAPGDILVSWLPPWHDFGLVRYVISNVFEGMTCHLVEPAVRTIPKWLATISERRATVTAAPDFAYRVAPRLTPHDAVDLSSLRFAANGAEPVRRSTIERFEEAFRVRNVVLPGYGLAESTLGVSAHAVGEPIVVDERDNVSCGPPLPDLEVAAGMSIDEPLEIMVRGPAVFVGYFDAPEETARVLRGGWLHTGDSGYLDPEGRLFVLGRDRAMIKRAGSVIAPRELEEAAERAERVRFAAAAGLPQRGDLHGDHVVVAVCADDRERRRVERAVTGEIVASLGFAPDAVLVLPRRSIPRTENGKLSYTRLRTGLLNGDIR